MRRDGLLQLGSSAGVVVVALALLLWPSAPALVAAQQTQGSASRLDLQSVLTLDGRLERTDTRAVYWQDVPVEDPSEEGLQPGDGFPQAPGQTPPGMGDQQPGGEPPPEDPGAPSGPPGGSAPAPSPPSPSPSTPAPTPAPTPTPTPTVTPTPTPSSRSSPAPSPTACTSTTGARTP